ncbi:MAG: toll/interleukin-1 receptor domain-containing protein [Thermoanaerobaculia bacterium]
MDDRILIIGDARYRKTDHHVFEVPLSALGPLRIVELPYGSTVEILGLPADPQSYSLSISATHAVGSPDSSNLFLHAHVTFTYVGDATDAAVRSACDRKVHRIRQAFRDLVGSGYVDDGDGAENRSRFNGKWFCGMLYSRYFSADENPVLAEFITPIVECVEKLLHTPELLLFLCHASEDKAFVDKLAAFLDANSVDVWYDKREIRIGDSIVEQINDGLERASHVVVVLSKSAVQKAWVQRELSSSLMRQLAEKSVRILPVVRETCDIPPLLADIRYADCRSDAESGFRKLVEQLRGER